MRAIFHAVLLVASVSASQLQRIDREAFLEDPLLRRLYHRRLALLRRRDRGLRSPRRASLLRTVPDALLPGYHPLVDKALTGDEVQELKQRQSAVNEAQGKLRGTVNDATMHMNDVEKIKRSIAQKEARLRYQKHKNHVLEDNVEQIELAHAKLVKSLHKTMDPKVEAAAARLKKKEEVLQNEKDATSYWAGQEEKVKTEAGEAIKEEEAAHSRLVELQGQLERSKQEESTAEKKSLYDQQMAKEVSQSLDYAKGQYDKQASELTAAQEKLKEVEATVGTNDDIRAMEQVEDMRWTVHADEDEAQNWKDNVEHISTQVSELSKENETSHNNLVELQSQISWTKQQLELAEKQYKLKQEIAAQEVPTLKYVKTKYEAEASKLKTAEAGAKSADESVKKLEAIREREEQKVKHHLARGKDKIQKKMREWEAERDETSREIGSLEQDYASWQEEQQQRRQEVEASEEAEEAASLAYSSRQQQTFNKAQTRAFGGATLDDAWNGEWTKES